ncbi:universal stress protein [Marivita sp.]|jgi:nucleotide-binding universal stress UspA family protein|uniref:universal stress protein n=1 Tax=Marivita sp. TaxID=2003365 RepID=UPI00321B6A07
MANTILLPVDLNNLEAASRPLTEALRLLDDGGTLHVLTVVPEFGYSQISGFFRDGYEKDLLRVAGQNLQEWAQTSVPDGIDLHPHVVHGSVYDMILRAADRLSVDSIVMGAHRPELSDYLLGPNAARVVRHAKQSVYVVRN